MEMEIVALILFVLVMLAGLAGTLVPVLPGLPLMWLAALGYGWFTNWRPYGFAVLSVAGLAALLSLALDQLAAVIGAKKFGAGRAGLIGSAVGGLGGLIFFSLPGLVLGVFFGAALAEFIFRGRSLPAALSAGFGAFLGFLAGSLFKFMLGLLFAGYFFWRLAAGLNF